MRHLAIFNDSKTIEKILKEEKLMEGRFSREKDLPYGKIKKGDEIYLKESGGKILGSVEVDNVLFYDNLTPEIIGKLRKEYNNDLAVDDKFWEKYSKSKYATLIFLKNPKRFLSKVKFQKRDRRSWVIVDK
jgi:predicted transcriptional regulator